MAVNIGQMATKKIGPLPAWAWVAALIGGVMFARMLRGSSDSTDNLSANDEVGDPGRPLDDPGPAGSDVTLPVGTVSGSAPGSGYDTTTLPSDSMSFPASDISSEMPWWLDPNYLASLTGVDTGDTSPVNTTTDNQPDPVTAVQQAQAFEWGGRVWTRSDLPAFKRYLQQHGTTFETWARNHATASQDVFGVRASTLTPYGVTGGGSKATQPGPAKQPTSGGGAPTAGAGVHAAPPQGWFSSAAASAVAMIRESVAKASPAPAHVASVPQAVVVNGRTIISPGSSAGPAPKPAPKYETYKNDVNLKKGQTLHFTPGRGYFAA